MKDIKKEIIGWRIIQSQTIWCCVGWGGSRAEQHYLVLDKNTNVIQITIYSLQFSFYKKQIKSQEKSVIYMYISLIQISVGEYN